MINKTLTELAEVYVLIEDTYGKDSPLLELVDSITEDIEKLIEENVRLKNRGKEY